MTNEPHKFEKFANSLMCKHCFKPKLQELHLPFLDENDILDPQLRIKKTSDDLDASEAIIFPPTTAGEAQRESNDESNEPDCYGHKCPRCNCTFYHSYKCWPSIRDSKVSEVMHCPACFGQANVEIHRNEDIDAIRQMQLRVSSPRDIAERMIEQGSYIRLEMSRRKNYEEWFANEFIPDIRRKIEALTSDMYAGKKELLRRRSEDLEKLTPEEIESYSRQSLRQKKIKKEDNLKNEKADWLANLKNMIKLVGNETIALQQLTKIYKSQNKDIPE
jgi:hypothetical protein